jgi:hypothetical protein
MAEGCSSAIASLPSARATLQISAFSMRRAGLDLLLVTRRGETAANRVPHSLRFL